jgi:hypothetical protein
LLLPWLPWIACRGLTWLTWCEGYFGQSNDVEAKWLHQLRTNSKEIRDICMYGQQWWTYRIRRICHDIPCSQPCKPILFTMQAYSLDVLITQGLLNWANACSPSTMHVGLITSSS